jgi:UDP-N-acetylglucosamine 1-carboxyvinyltransferase
MDKFLINGGKSLYGEVRVSGAKNAVLKLMSASILASDRCVIRNVPDIIDVHTMLGVLEALGLGVEFDGENSMVTIEPRTSDELINHEAPYELVKEMRASIQVMGPLLAKVRMARISYPGGCDLGSRPIDYHLNGFKALGAIIREEQGYILAEAPNGLKGTEITLDFPSVGATENIMAAATLAKGTTVIYNAAREPEIIEQQNFYNAMGARITGAGTDKIVVEGVNSLGSADYTLMPDRIETGTFMVAVAITGGDILIKDVIPEHVSSIMAKVVEAGAKVVKGHDWLRVSRNGLLQPITVQTMPYPGFPTDMQPQIAVLASLAKGSSIITENIFTSRFKHVDELRRMGANIRTEGRTIFIRGVEGLSGTTVKATDLRAGAAMVLAGLVAEGTTVVEEVQHIDRGYEALEEKLSSLGASIERVKDNNQREMAVS